MTPRDKDQGFIQCDQWLEILEELNIGAFTVDFNRKVRAMNYSAQALMGLRESDVVGTDCREVFWGVPCLVECLIRGDDESQGVEPDVALNDGEDHKFLVTRMATPIFDHQHNMVGCLTILQDHSPIADLINRVQYDERNMKIVLDNLDVGSSRSTAAGSSPFSIQRPKKPWGINATNSWEESARAYSKATRPRMRFNSRRPSPMEKHAGPPAAGWSPQTRSPSPSVPITWP